MKSNSLYHMIELAAKQYDIVDFCHSSVFKLKDYDTTHQTEYLKTVYTYITNMKNLVLTADALHIHRNTLTYRLRKIFELLGYNLDNEDLMIKIFVSCKIMTYLL
ncbi:helix-turn-helix domain-containing protein [Eubacteriaceae bacterium ES2]|nr:helix-turn-helix domain-containing protein [Eubacteriaceae bacterium ES2]